MDKRGKYDARLLLGRHDARQVPKQNMARCIDDGDRLCKYTVAEWEGWELLHGGMQARDCSLGNLGRNSFCIILCIPIYENLAFE